MRWGFGCSSVVHLRRGLLFSCWSCLYVRGHDRFMHVLRVG